MPVGLECTKNRENQPGCMLWALACPSAAGGIDNPMINPIVVGCW